MSKSAECALWAYNVLKEHCSREQLDMVHQQLFKYAVFQLEVGTVAGKEHWQCEGSLITRASKSGLLERLAMLGFDRTHWTCDPIPTAQAKMIKNINMLKLRYANKAETRVDGPFEYSMEEPQYIPIQSRGITLRAWQQRVLDTVERDCNDGEWRVINYLYDPIGKQGKGTLRSFVSTRRLGHLMPNFDRPELIIQAAENMFRGKDTRQPKLCIWDVPRDTERKVHKAILRAAETVKDGIVCDPRHNYKEWVFDSPCIWIFSNEPPMLKGLSKDRWRCYRLEDGNLELYDPYGCEISEAL